ncbi:hypothetical protein KDK95_13045 [Actinospica sp. MGRD01-02]|uniref:Uncharacterized protein n=1 Tax=Actinospica acidithermotolerans TaxID=2828514 RepID=A0A941E9U6_9ACTN|nr:hypothetical protein [Actinospica acidithermotolerans]MBR7827237.1 hypothetical protein [Actinospica acidithermotolerans]
MKRADGGSHDDGAWLSDALRDRTRGHEADLERITARFEQLTTGQAAPRAQRRRPLGPMRMRLLGIPLGIAAALASATVAVAVSVGIAVSASPHPRAVVPVTSPKTSALSTTAAPSSPSTSSAPTEGATTPATTRATGNGGVTGRLATAASVDAHSTEYWVQENLTVTPASTIRSLRITVTVSGGSGVASTGIWTTIPSANLVTTVTRASGGLVYEVALKSGQSLGPTVYRFGFQFNRPASGHDFALDTYSVTATAADGESLSGSGAF